MTLDFSRSSAPCAGPLNIARSTAVACCYVALKHVFTDVPANAGCLAPIEFVIPDTTLLGVSWPKPVGGYTETILRVIGVVFGAIARIAPDKATAAPFGTINALSLAGYRSGGQRWVMFSFFGGGLGGNPETDGLNHGNNPISMATIPPAEILEAAYPVLFTQWALRPDSAGAGLHRGGLGAIYEIEALVAVRRGCVSARRARLLCAIRGQRRRPRGAECFLVADRRWRGASAARLESHRREDSAKASGCGWRRQGAAAGATRARAMARSSPATCGSAISPPPPRMTTIKWK